MNISKAEAKLGVLNSLGADFDDQREAVERDLLRWSGVLEAYKAVKQKIETEILGIYKMELQDEKITAEEHKAAVRAIKRCIGLAEHLNDRAYAAKLTKEGEKQALIKNIGHIKDQYDRQLKALEAIREAIENPDTPEEQKQALVEGRPHLVAGKESNALIDLQQRKDEARIEKVDGLKARLQDLISGGADQAEIDDVKRNLLTLQSMLPPPPPVPNETEKKTTKKKITKKKRKKTKVNAKNA